MGSWVSWEEGGRKEREEGKRRWKCWEQLSGGQGDEKRTGIQYMKHLLLTHS